MKVNHRVLRRMATWRRYLMVLLPALLCMTPAAATQTITYYHLDATGSPVAATNQAGTLLWRETYKPYGDRYLNQAAASGNSHWYTGKPYDSAIGLSYFGARYYDPVVGRFMGVDPKEFSPDNLHSFNRYAYGNSNPYRYLDPNGLWSTEAHNYFIDQAFPAMSNTIRGYIKEGSRAADGLYNQIVPGQDHIHSMWGSGGSAETMQRARSDYISARLHDFGELMGESSEYRERGVTGIADDLERRAWIEYGKALHPIMDSTSPVHNQEWHIKDRHVHGSYPDSREDIKAAPASRDETVRRMQNFPSFIRQ